VSVFADSSALVKRYADEPGADDVRALPLLVVSALARVEVPAAFWRKVRTGQLSAADAAVLASAFQFDCADPAVLVVVAPTVGVLEHAARLVAVHPLRAYDAVQLASALAVRAADREVTEFACFDAGLRSAAAAEGLVVVL